MNTQNEIVFFTGTQTKDTEKGIFRCTLNPLDGSMRIVSSTDGIENSTYLVVNSIGDRLYAVSEKSDGEVFVYVIDNKTGELHLLDRKPTQGADPCYISLSSDGQFVFVSNYSGGNVNVFRIGDNGTLEEKSCMITHSGHSVNPDRQESPHPHSIFPDPSGKFVLVCDLGIDQVVVYRLEEGELVKHHEVDLPPGAGPRHFDFHPTGKWAYCANELNNEITVFTYDDKTADLHTIQSISTLPDDYNEGVSYPADIHVSSCGRFLYASNRGHDSIVQYDIDLDTGNLTAVDWQSTQGEYPRNFTIVEGGYVLVANHKTGNVVSYFMDSETGRLTATGCELELPIPMCVQPLSV
ncbi:lactonase family protein [Paenibacillus glacialis]|uniref:6-phosphogluconolactonase n=1 Tax=Paenibacillus glacialis TaxID=494026 RepID=A0A168N4C2_9BACL|nr:lactonase family protein [Paenibacillus glacialis]OAB45375.1 6-phosphogluconolactonase [Paenibacillus glacialis]